MNPGKCLRRGCGRLHTDRDESVLIDAAVATAQRMIHSLAVTA